MLSRQIISSPLSRNLANELPLFCRILKKLDNEGGIDNNEIPRFLSMLNLVLRMFPSYQLGVDAFADIGSSSRVSWSPRSLPQQRRLLEPFAALHSLKNIKITDVEGKT